MLRKLRRLRNLCAGELLVFSQLVLFASIARIALVFVSLPRITRVLSWGADQRLFAHLPVLHNRYGTQSLARLADLAANAVRPDGPCLLRSTLLFWLLRARGGQAELLIGVNKENGNLNSHAWIEARGRIVGDDVAMVRRFNIFARF